MTVTFQEGQRTIKDAIDVLYLRNENSERLNALELVYEGHELIGRCPYPTGMDDCPTYLLAVEVLAES